jgi:hypothetical protein
MDGGYRATPKLERELARHGTAQVEGGRYRATVAQAGPTYFEAWTDSLPFVYGRPSSTLQGALDNLEAAVREAETRRQAS